MAFVKMTGEPKKDLGEWREMGKDPSHPGLVVKFRLRRIPWEEDQAILAKFGKEETVQLTDGEKSAHVRQRVLSVDDFKELAVRRSVYAWTEAENFYVQPTDRAACAMVASALGLAADEVKEGDEYCLDKKVSFLKAEILSAYPLLAEAIVGELNEMDKAYNKIEKSLGKTS